jgi:hypothetical protein
MANTPVGLWREKILLGSIPGDSRQLPFSQFQTKNLGSALEKTVGEISGWFVELVI